MARRIDYYDDPDAPAVNSMVASVNVVVTNAAGEVLLICRSDLAPAVLALVRGEHEAALTTCDLAGEAVLDRTISGAIQPRSSAVSAKEIFVCPGPGIPQGRTINPRRATPGSSAAGSRKTSRAPRR